MLGARYSVLEPGSYSSRMIGKDFDRFPLLIRILHQLLFNSQTTRLSILDFKAMYIKRCLKALLIYF